LESNRWTEAGKKYQQALRLDSYDWLAWARRGEVLSRLKRYDQGVKAYKCAIEIRPNNEWLLTSLGNLLLRTKRGSEAVVYLKRAKEIKPQKAHTTLLLADALRETGSYEAALDQYNSAALQGDKKIRLEALAGSGHILVLLGRNGEALTKYRDALAIDPNHRPAKEGLRRMEQAPKA
jgi:tetratricopeptide (TPR) repeat protein